MFDDDDDNGYDDDDGFRILDFRSALIPLSEDFLSGSPKRVLEMEESIESGEGYGAHMFFRQSGRDIYFGHAINLLNGSAGACAFGAFLLLDKV